MAINRDDYGSWLEYKAALDAEPAPTGFNEGSTTFDYQSRYNQYISQGYEPQDAKTWADLEAKYGLGFGPTTGLAPTDLQAYVGLLDKYDPNRGYDTDFGSRLLQAAPFVMAGAGAAGLLGTGATTFGGAVGAGEVAAGGAMDMMGSAGVGSSLGGGATASAAELGAGSALASGAGATAMASEPIAAASPLAAPTATPMVAPEVASFGAAPVAGAPEVIGSQLGATSLGTGLTTVSPEFVAASGAAGGLGTAAGTGLATSLIGAGLGTATGGGGIIESLLSDPKKLAQIGGGAWQIYEGLRAEGKIDEANAYLKQAFERSDPFAPARAGAMDQYMQWQKDPMSYMSSPLAQMQIDQMNRAARAKQASLGQTWNIGADGGIQGSGIGAVDFARELQTNLAKQYETALGNRAQQAGMNLFPNMQALGQMGSMIGQGVDATQQTGAGAGNVLGGLWGVFGDDIKKGVFGA